MWTSYVFYWRQGRLIRGQSQLLANCHQEYPMTLLQMRRYWNFCTVPSSLIIMKSHCPRLRITRQIHHYHYIGYDEFTMSDCSDDETPPHQRNQHVSLGLPPALPGSSNSFMPKVDHIATPQKRNREREWAEIKSSSGPGSGEFERMLNAAKPWRGSVSSSKASSLIHSSLSIRTKEAKFFKKGFQCCGKKWSDLHQLTEHKETAHP